MDGKRRACCALALALALVLLPRPAPAEAGDEDVLAMSVVVLATPSGFVPDLIVVPRGPVDLNVTLVGDDPNRTHTFTITSGGLPIVNITAAQGARANASFRVNGTTVTVAGTEYTADGTGGIRYLSDGGPEGLIKVAVPVGTGGLPVVFIEVQATSAHEGSEDHPKFVPNRILMGQKDTIVHLTVRNVFVTLMDSFHTFTIDKKVGGRAVDLPLNRNEAEEIEFIVRDTDKIEVGGVVETVETERDGIRFYCIPHEGNGMIGHIAIGSAAAAGGEEAATHGIFLRAYWIGVVGFLATIALVVASYWVIKGGSRHHRDETGHVRRGLP